MYKGTKCFIERRTQHILFTVIWCRTYDKGPLRSREETQWRYMGYSFQLAARVLLYASSHRQDNTYQGLCYTSHGALAGTRNSSMGPPYRKALTRDTVKMEAKCSSMVQCPFMVQWVIGSIPHSRSIDPFLIPARAPQLVNYCTKDSDVTCPFSHV